MNAGAIRCPSCRHQVRCRIWRYRHTRARLQPIIRDIVDRVLELTIDLLADERARPAHVKAYMATATAALKVDIAARFDTLTRAGSPVANDTVIRAATQVLREEVVLDERQVQAAAAIAGTDRLVSVTGPAGAGKTTILRAAKAALSLSGGRMVVVAPTKKAASVAGREIGATASSLHALLADHGFRWGRDDAGAEAWTRLARGDADPTTGVRLRGHVGSCCAQAIGSSSTRPAWSTSTPRMHSR